MINGAYLLHYNLEVVWCQLPVSSKNPRPVWIGQSRTHHQDTRSLRWSEGQSCVCGVVPARTRCHHNGEDHTVYFKRALLVAANRMNRPTIWTLSPLMLLLMQWMNIKEVRPHMNLFKVSSWVKLYAWWKEGSNVFTVELMFNQMHWLAMSYGSLKRKNIFVLFSNWISGACILT